MNCVVWELNLNEVIKGENLEASSFVGSDRTCVSESPITSNQAVWGHLMKFSPWYQTRGP